MNNIISIKEREKLGIAERNCLVIDLSGNYCAINNLNCSHCPRRLNKIR